MLRGRKHIDNICDFRISSRPSRGCGEFYVERWKSFFETMDDCDGGIGRVLDAAKHLQVCGVILRTEGREAFL
jgi:hypothetical protein